MAVELKKDSIDLGIVTRDAGPMVAFYRDLLGFTDEGQMPMPNIGTMTRLRCGTSLIKIVEATPKSDAVDKAYCTLWDLGHSPMVIHE